MNWRGVMAATAFVAAGCNQDVSTPHPSRPDINPRSFVLLPCGPARSDPACVLAVAGGKRVLLGAPAGVAETLSTDDLRQLDGVMLFSLRAVDMEGLDEVRNASWQAGRSEPLRVVGPDGTDQVVQALNRAYEQADAMRIVTEGMPPGGFDAAVLTGQSVVTPHLWYSAFDTGDFKIEAYTDGVGFVAYRLSYSVQVMIASCGEGNGTLREASGGSVKRWLACEHDDMSWPLRRAEFIVKKQDG